MVEIDGQVLVQVGSTVRYRSGRAAKEEWRTATSRQLIGDESLGEQEITIVASDLDVGRHRLTPRSPLARALLGGGIGDKVLAESPGGRWEVSILAVDFEGIWG